MGSGTVVAQCKFRRPRDAHFSRSLFAAANSRCMFSRPLIVAPVARARARARARGPPSRWSVRLCGQKSKKNISPPMCGSVQNIRRARTTTNEPPSTAVCTVQDLST